MDEMSIYDLDEDGSYYDDDWDDYDNGDDYYQAWGWRYRLRTTWYKVEWAIKRNFTRCKVCKRRLKNCECPPF